MVASLFSNGQASTMGLTKTSMRPLQIAYIVTLIKIPANAFGSKSGKRASAIKPAADKTSDATIETLYPILSTNLAQKRSTKSCVKKKQRILKLCFQAISHSPYEILGIEAAQSSQLLPVL